eukprot:15365822-Ditylum_brightwellii.AAC.1
MAKKSLTICSSTRHPQQRKIGWQLAPCDAGGDHLMIMSKRDGTAHGEMPLFAKEDNFSVLCFGIIGNLDINDAGYDPGANHPPSQPNNEKRKQDYINHED